MYMPFVIHLLYSSISFIFLSFCRGATPYLTSLIFKLVLQMSAKIQLVTLSPRVSVPAHLHTKM